MANVTRELTSIAGATVEELAPITTFTLNVVGPIDKESTILSSGAGTIKYSSFNALTPSISLPNCTETKVSTAEKANTVYGDLPSAVVPTTTLMQTFSIQTTESALARRPNER